MSPIDTELQILNRILPDERFVYELIELEAAGEADTVLKTGGTDKVPKLKQLVNG
jgi:hypothetical protein